ncbi:MAG: CBS domain-containing protein [Candidatus Omnitrophota bacterium]
MGLKEKEDLLNKKLKEIKAKDIMTRENIVTAKEDDHLAQVADYMIRNRISGMPVVNDEGRVSGVITATDLFLLMDMLKSGKIVENTHSSPYNPTVKFAMTYIVMKIDPDTGLDEIADIMKLRNIHTLPVYEGETMVGIVGRRDVLKHFYAALKSTDSA